MWRTKRRAHSRPPFAFAVTVAPREPAPQAQAERAPDFRRVIPRPQWLANRARNALRRPVFIGAVSVAAFLTAIVSMVVAPRASDRATVAPPPKPRPDTMSVLAGIAIARVRLASIDSTIVLERSAVVARVVDSTAFISQVMRDRRSRASHRSTPRRRARSRRRLPIPIERSGTLPRCAVTRP